MTNLTPLRNQKHFELFNRPYILILLAILFWSSNIILVRAVRAEIPPIGLAFWRWLVGFILILKFAWTYLKSDFSQILRHWKLLALFALLGVALFNTLVYIGLGSTTAINGAMIIAATPIAIAIVSYCLFRDKLSLMQMLGIGIAFTGVITVAIKGDWQNLFNLSFNRGDLLIIVAVICYALYVSLLRLRREILHPLSFLAVTFGLGTIMLLPLYLWETLSGNGVHLNSVTVLSIAYSAIFPSILAYFCYDRGVELVGPNQAGLFFNLRPLFISAMAVVFLHESFRLFHAVAIVLILSGILLFTRSKSV